MADKVEKPKIIAIDGPAGSGKSTAAVGLARRLGFLYINTGAMDRALTLKMIREGIDVADQEGIIALLPKTTISFRKNPAKNEEVLLDGEDVTSEIRSSEVTRNVSAVSAIPAVREYMVEQQRRLARGNNVVIEGRDIATVVFPDAEHKFFIDADIDTRAARCRNDYRKRGIDITLDEVKQDLCRRDHIDSTRKIAPLIKTADAIVVDTSSMTPEQVVDKIVRKIIADEQK